MLRSPGEEEEPGPCVSAHSLSGDSAQTMDYTAELHTGVEEIQSHEVTPFGMASQVDAAVGVGQYAHRPIFRHVPILSIGRPTPMFLV